MVILVFAPPHPPPPPPHVRKPNLSLTVDVSITTTTARMPTDSYSKGLMIALGITFLIFPCIFVGLRFWAKWHQRRSLQWDDFLIFLALVGLHSSEIGVWWALIVLDILDSVLDYPTYR